MNRLARPAGRREQPSTQPPERVSRAVDGVRRAPRDALPRRGTVLFVAANGGSPLDLTREMRQIVRRLEASPLRLRLATLPDARVDELIEVLRLHRPAVVHFGGHGLRGALVMRDAAGDETEVTADEVRLWFKRLARDGQAPQLVVLNGCTTEKPARAAAGYARFAIGTTTAIADVTAVAFTDALYQALAAGESVSIAFQATQLRLGRDGVRYRMFQSTPRRETRVWPGLLAVGVAAAALSAAAMWLLLSITR